RETSPTLLVRVQIKRSTLFPQHNLGLIGAHFSCRNVSADSKWCATSEMSVHLALARQYSTRSADANDNVTTHLPAARGSPQHRRVRRYIQSFDPHHLQPEDFHDISHRERIPFTIVLDGQKLRPSFFVRYTGNSTFPEGTQGYFYYSPSTTQDVSDGEIRFRVTKPGDPAATFKEGHDLLSPTGIRWRLPVLKSFAGRFTVSARRLLIKENLPLKDHQVKPPLPRNKFPTNRYIRNLDPQHITSSDFRDISGLFGTRFYVETFEETPQQIFYERTRGYPFLLSRFPPGTHGFLYYHRQTGGTEEGQVRFRITKDANPTSFAEGEDLLLRKGFPWYIPESRLHLSGLASLISKDDVATKPEMIPAEQQDVTRYDRLPLVVRDQNRPVFAFGQLFSLSFSSMRNCIWIGYGERRRMFLLRHPLFVLNEGRRPQAIYDGIAFCCVEPSPLPTDQGSIAVVLRLCKIVSPITLKKRDQLPKNLDLRHIPKPPKTGELFEQHASVWVYRPRLDTQNFRALEFLFRAQADNSEGGGTLKSAV
ncbi:hypothetical protein EW146_g10258, partial [Bondarzewia mesenterica]